MGSDGYERICFETDAPEVLEYLRPSQPHWLEGAESSDAPIWVFRGQPSHRLALLPRLHRLTKDGSQFEDDKVRSVHLGSTKRWSMNLILAAREIELYLVSRFHHLADRLGLSATLTQSLAQSFSSMETGNDHSFNVPTNTPKYLEFINALTVAQHYRVSTSLLDWTASSLVALYFACQALQNPILSEDNYIVIWAVRRALLIDDHLAFFRLIDPVVANNVFARAQAGYFTLDTLASHSFFEGKGFKPHDELIRERIGFHKREAISLREVRISTILVQKIFYLLYHEGISAATISPSLENVTLSVIEGATRVRAG